MAKSNPSTDPPKSTFDMVPVFGLLVGAATLMKHHIFSVILGSILVLLSLCLLIFKCELNWVKRRKWIKTLGYFLSVIIAGSLAFDALRPDRPDIVLKIDPISYPIKREGDYLYSMNIMGRLPSYVSKGYSSASVNTEQWSSPMPDSRFETFRYTLINRGKTVLYNLKLDFDIYHYESKKSGTEVGQGHDVYHFLSGVRVDELVPTPTGNFVFYASNLSDDFVSVEPAKFLTNEHDEKINIRLLGQAFPMAPKFLLGDKDEKK